MDHKDPDYTSLLRFDALWEAYYRMNSLLVFSTGRSQVLYNELRSEVPLLTPGIAIMSVGTEIRYGDTMEEDKGWVKELDVGWNRSIIVEEAEKLNLKFQVTIGVYPPNLPGKMLNCLLSIPSLPVSRWDRVCARYSLRNYRESRNLSHESENF